MTAELQLPEPGELIGSKYQVERLLGMGGMGAVYEAAHRVTGKRFALKLLLPQLTTHDDVVKRFIREAQVAGRFQHPNVVEVYDVGEHGPSLFMVMELLRGESLAARLEREQRLPVDVSCRLMMQCLDGVAAAHAAGIIHRDLKPANIFLCTARKADFVAKVLDFGISKLTEVPGIPKATTTDTGTVMGTPFYMAPEQLRSKGVDHRADIYALGVTLYQLLSGRQPYVADNYPDLVIKIWTETPPSLQILAPETPLALAEVVARAMARSAADRYESAESMARALEPFASGTRSPSAPPAAASSRVPAARPSQAPQVRTDSEVMSASAKRHQGSLETTLRTATPFASESLASPRLREPRSWSSVVGWTIAACVLILAAYGVWRGVAGVANDQAAARQPQLQPSAAPAQVVQSPVGQPLPQPSAAAMDKVSPAHPPLQEPVESRENRAPAAPSSQLGVREPARVRAQTAPAIAQPQSASARRAVPAPPRENVPRVGEAARLTVPASAGQLSAAPSRPAVEPPVDVEAQNELKPAPVHRPNPAIDRTQF